MNSMPFYINIVKALEEIEAPYMIVGAYAGMAFGVTRVTFDVDILVDLREEDMDTLAARFPLPNYYADPIMMRESTQLGIMFNIIDSRQGIKADLVPLSREPGYEVAFARRVRKILLDPEGNPFEAWCAQPTDIIIGKLKAWTEGRSAKHPSDIHQILSFDFKGLSSQSIDMDAITAEAARLGDETLAIWNKLHTRAWAEVHPDPNP